MTLEELLRSAARDVADRAPDGYVAPYGISARATAVRRRQRVGAVAGRVAATAAVAVGVEVVSGGSPDAQEPIAPSPSPSPTTGATTAPAAPDVEVPEITPEDLREYEELRTMTNTQPGSEGLTELVFEVPVRDRYSYEWDAFCSGDPDTWFVYIVGDNGGAGYGYCNSPAPVQFPTFPPDISPVGHSGTTATTQVIRMFVVDEIPANHLTCFDLKSPPECLDINPPLEPVASTDVEFGISVYEYWAPPVAQVLGRDFAARAVVDGTDYLLSQVLTPADGQHSFATTLPPTEGDRIVTVVDQLTDAAFDCERAAGAECQPFLELRIGDRTISLERGQRGDFETTAAYPGPHGFLRVPAGDEEVELRVASGDPDHIDFALVVFEETS